MPSFTGHCPCSCPILVSYGMPVIYEWCLCLELKDRGLRIQDQEHVEIKAIEMTLPIHKAQLLSYMKLTRTPVGLLIPNK